MEQVNHIKIVENFFKYLNDKYYCKIETENKYPVSEEKRMLSNVVFSRKCEIFIRTALPYTIRKLKSGNYIFLNREYKPLCIFAKSWGDLMVDYEQFEFLSFEYNNADIDGIYFYNDGNRPQDSKKDYIKYLIRLKYFLIDYKNNQIKSEKNYYRY